jgi:hypothetical protein
MKICIAPLTEGSAAHKIVGDRKLVKRASSFLGLEGGRKLQWYREIVPQHDTGTERACFASLERVQVAERSVALYIYMIACAETDATSD